MRIAFLISSLRGGGSERVCVSLANAMVQKGHSLTIYCLNLLNAKYDGELRPEIELRNLEVAHLRLALPRLLPIVAGNRHDCLLSFNFEITIVLVVMKMLLRSRCPVVARTPITLSAFRSGMSGIWRRHVTHWFARCFYRRADLIIAQCEEMREDLVQQYRCAASRTVVIPNPLNPRLIESDTPPLPPSAGRRLLFVGSLLPRKDPELLLRAFAVLKQHRHDVSLTFAGAGPLLPALQQRAQELGLAGNVRFLGFVAELSQLYRETDLTVLSSRAEGFPNVLLESMAAGTPVVSVACPAGPRELIREGINGFLVPNREPGALAAAMDRALGHAWDRSAIRASVQHHRIDVVRDRYLDVLSNLVGMAQNHGRIGN